MGKKLKTIKIFKLIFIFNLIFLLKIGSAMAASTVKQFDTQQNVSANKVWTVNFNMPLDGTTINKQSIVIKDKSSGSIISAIPAVLSSADKVIVNPPVGGYLPKHSYNLTVQEDVTSEDEKKLTQTASIDFTIEDRFEDGTSYQDLPQVESSYPDSQPVVSGHSSRFIISSKDSGQVQYRVFVSKDGTNTYDELTSGYTKPVDGNANYVLIPLRIWSEGKYKMITYVKNANDTDFKGTYEDDNTDYDNYLVTYFNCLGSETQSTLTTVDSNYSLKQVVDAEYNTNSAKYYNNGWTTLASRSQIEYYLNPYNFLDDTGKYQFLNLNYKENYTADDINKVLEGKGVLSGKGDVFLKAAKDNNIDVAYLVSHSLLETGNGTSQLSCGVDVNSVDGSPVESKKVYNMFGIGAADADALRLGAETAYKNGWFTVDDAISGGAKWIASGYIANVKYMQNTDYKMRWNPDVIWHQYATDVNWANAQAADIKEIMDNYPNAVLVFEIPKYK